ncbi:unnamed protein product [Microthlaspi erraticum]|uniref:Uncharacterized protein n=1 Tax=Microthlaspi erraticum TaxID=1685480 RepID=A0A6D2JI73_9BRAS|nr:unnamed protein product [Microthlaspi erraticum]
MVPSLPSRSTSISHLGRPPVLGAVAMRVLVSFLQPPGSDVSLSEPLSPPCEYSSGKAGASSKTSRSTGFLALCFFWPFNHCLLSFTKESDALTRDLAFTVHAITVGSLSGDVFLKLAAAVISTGLEANMLHGPLGPICLLGLVISSYFLG